MGTQGLAGLGEEELARHAEVGEERSPAGEVPQQELPVAAQGLDALALQLLERPGRPAPAQLRRAPVDALDAAAAQLAVEAAPDGLDLRKLGHGQG